MRATVRAVATLSPYFIVAPLLAFTVACGGPAGADKTVDGALVPLKKSSSTTSTKISDSSVINKSSMDLSKDTAITDIPGAKKVGLTIGGIKDTSGYKRVFENYIKANPVLSRPIFDEKLAKELGAVKDMAEFAAIGSSLANLDVYRIELIPGITKYEGIGDALKDPTGQTSDGSDFFPGFPSKGSLSGFQTGRTEVRDGNNTRGGHTYSDGSSHIVETSRDSNGGVVNYSATTNADGSFRWAWKQQLDKDGAIVSDQENWGDTTQPSEAGEVWDQHPDPNNGGAPSDGGAVQDSGGAEGEKNPIPDNPYIDQYQPAGDNGVFCPLSVEFCRRGLEKALASGQNVLVGMLLINPGEPDDQPKATRLVFDPKGLLINPDPVNNSGPAGSGKRRFRMELPVWVNPAGPND